MPNPPPVIGRGFLPGSDYTGFKTSTTGGGAAAPCLARHVRVRVRVWVWVCVWVRACVGVCACSMRVLDHLVGCMCVCVCMSAFVFVRHALDLTTSCCACVCVCVCGATSRNGGIYSYLNLQIIRGFRFRVKIIYGTKRDTFVFNKLRIQDTA